MGRNNLKLHISRLLALLLAVSSLFAVAPVAFAAGGSCGVDATWSLENGTLTISGSGAINDYSRDDPAPWYSSRQEIRNLVLSEGLTRIGSWAFQDCTNLVSVSMPSTMSVIADGAFFGCTGLTMLSLNEGLYTIGQSAFSQCRSLVDLRLPQSLLMIDHQAFYMCTSLSYVTIPSGVNSFGSGVFAYCDSLLRVDVKSNLTLPGFTFYGCDSLQSVTVSGESVNPENLKVVTLPDGSTQTAAQGSTSGQQLPTSSQEGIAYDMKSTANEDGTQVQSNTIVRKDENATTVNKTTTTTADGGTTVQKDITATVITPDGWNSVIQEAQSASGVDSGNADLRVYDVQGDTVAKNVLQDLSGTSVTMTVQTQNGTQFKLDCTQLPEKVKKDLNLSYTLVPADKVPAELEGCTVFRLTFHESADIRVEMLMRLPGDYSYQTATLYQMKKGETRQLQSVMVDADGNAHWYLRNIDHKTEYLIGINIPGAVEDSPIIPAELADIQKVANVYDGVEYVVTGRTSSWNMGLGKVMAILAVVMISTISVVGFAMYVLNKRRLKSGYVPQWDDEDE